MLHHIELYVSDLERTREYWTWLLDELGYESFQNWEHGFSLKHGDTYIVFVQVDKEHSEAGYHRKRVGLNHLAFHASSKKQVDSLAAQIKVRGDRLLYEDQYPYAGGPGYYALYAEDPDRIKVEIVAPL